jgi:hypothetical protein
MDEQVEQRARQAALADWQDEKVRHLVVGLLATDRPLLSPGRSPFYTATMGCEASQENLAFCAAYNAAVAELLQQHGVPIWAPAARLPDRQDALDLLTRDGMEGLTLEQPPHEERLVATLRHRWAARKAQPCVWCRDRARGLLLVGGNLSPEVGKVEVLDVKQMQWMASYEFFRKHVPRFPWNELAAN